MTEIEDIHYLAVYGTLKENFPNYFYYLNPRKPIFRGLVQLPYQMYSNGGFPLLFPSEEMHQIYIEVFHVNDLILDKIDRLEDVPNLYTRTKIWIDEINSEVFFYITALDEPQGELIKDGIFKKME